MVECQSLFIGLPFVEVSILGEGCSSLVGKWRNILDFYCVVLSVWMGGLRIFGRRAWGDKVVCVMNGVESKCRCCSVFGKEDVCV